VDLDQLLLSESAECSQDFSRDARQSMHRDLNGASIDSVGLGDEPTFLRLPLDPRSHRFRDDKMVPDLGVVEEIFLPVDSVVEGDWELSGIDFSHSKKMFLIRTKTKEIAIPTALNAKKRMIACQMSIFLIGVADS